MKNPRVFITHHGSDDTVPRRLQAIYQRTAVLSPVKAVESFSKLTAMHRT